MKIRAFILALMVLFFTVQPILLCCQMKVEKQKASTCNKSKSKSCKKEKSPCDNTTGTSSNSGACNPFASCSQCQYLDCSKFICPETMDKDIANKATTFNEPIAAGHLTDCWQPPELV